MGTVIDLKTRKEVKPPAPAKPTAISNGAQYECQRCTANTFKLYSDGVVQCAECDARINNIIAQFKKGEKAS